MQRAFLISSFVVFFSMMVFTLPGQAYRGFREPVPEDLFFDRYLRGGHLTYEYSDDSTTSVVKTEIELELRFRAEEFSGFARLSNDRPFGFQTGPFGVDKRGFNFELNDDWEITGGDYSLVFARGIALNAVEIREVDNDTQLDGLNLQGRTDDYNLTLFWGRHKSDSIEYYLSGVNTNMNGPSDGLRGGRIELDLNDFDIGFSYVDAAMTRWDEHQSTVATELDMSWRLGDVDLYYETVWFERVEPEWMEEDETLDGRAQLAEFLYAVPGVSIAGSWVRYNNAHFDYGTAPSLRRPETDDANARPDDETGYRIDTRFSPETWNGNTLRIMYADLNGIENTNWPYVNYFVEWLSPRTTDWTGNISYDRITGFLVYYGALEGTDTSWRAAVDGPFFGDTSFHLSGRYRTLGNEFESDKEVELGFDWAFSPELTIGFIRETSSREYEPPVPGMNILPGESPGRWNSAFIRYTPDAWNQLDLIIGSQRGGFQCAGGTCALVPPFDGVKLIYYRTL